jgi:hypothetical protein
VGFFFCGVNTIMPRRVFNLERDIRSTDWVLNKIRKQEIYAQNLYAALCNNHFQPRDTWGILSNITWSCDWRYAANLIADIRQTEDYLTWYCSGTGFKIADLVGFVEESYITQEIESDFTEIGWIVPTKTFIDW